MFQNLFLCVGDARSASQADMSVILLVFAIFWPSDLNGPITDVTADRQVNLQHTHTLQVVCFLKCCKN
jgi:hypothetical protein